MNQQQIREIALANGFKLKTQSDGGLDLNPYVYDFARALIQTAQQQAVPKGWVVLPVDLVATRMHLARKYNANRVHTQLSNTIFPKKSQEAE